jgi:TatD DNase family protein
MVDGESPEAVLKRAEAAGVATIVTVGTDLASSAECASAAAGHDGVFAAVGIHPHNAIEATDGVLERLTELAGHHRVVAIGETGLDYFRDQSPRVRQAEAFRDHIRIANDLDKALVVHDREAHDDVFAILDEERAPSRTVLHCFSGDAELVGQAAQRGWFVSFAGNVTFRNAPELREAAAAVPLQSLVAETDAPFMSPHPYRGQPNEPARVTVTVAQLAQLHGLDEAEMARITSANAAHLFALAG